MLTTEQFVKLSIPFHFPIPTQVIPRFIFTSWHTSRLPPIMKQNLIQLARDNREFQICFYDEPMCERFIQTNFPADVLDAYRRLIPNAYKSDLWRLCVLYIYGGIYVDIKFKCINGFRFIHLTDQEHFVRDLDESGGGICNGLMAALPKNSFIHTTIQQIVSNVKTRFYGTSYLYPSGPMLLREIATSNNITTSMSLNSLTIPNIRTAIFVIFRDCIILTSYKEYRDEQVRYQGTQHYAILWKQRNIYTI
jgi:mannosyltransferase OCH1-like enzyme